MYFYYLGSVSFTQWIQKLEVSQKIDKKLILKCGEKHINILVIDSENDPSGFIFQKSTLSLIEEEEKNNIKNCKYRDYNPKIDDGKYVSSVVGVLNKSKLNSNQNEINFGDCSDTFLSALKTHSKKKCFRVVYSPPSSFLSRLYYTFIA